MCVDRRNRIFIIPKIADAFASVSSVGHEQGYVRVPLCGASDDVAIFQCPSFEGEAEGCVYNFPFLFNADGTPWIEANSFLLESLRNKSVKSRPADLVRVYADRLLNYALFCESKGVDWCDFSGVRITHRPTYRYYAYLCDESGLSPAVINQSTGVVYRFIKYVSRCWREIDMSRVDTVKSIKLYVGGDQGLARTVTVEVRSQTIRLPKEKQIPVGYCLDEGEKLRPLSNGELEKLLGAINHADWAAQERLIVMFALMTGARKQSVLTMRYAHARALERASIRSDGSYVLKAGPGTDIDTKFNKPQTLYVPSQLAEEVVVFANSDISTERRKEFIARRRLDGFGAEIWNESNVYLFLSEQANCFYMAKSDSRYASVKTLPRGQVTKSLQTKLARQVGLGFPRNFSFHWLRATFAYQLYQQLVPHINAGKLSYVDAVSIIQERLHHEDRQTTENYLKLFSMTHERLMAQELYEQRLFGFSTYADLNLIEREAC